MREIGKRVGLSHQTVKRVLRCEPVPIPTFPWNEKLLSRDSLRRELRKLLKQKRGVVWRRVDTKYEIRWIGKILDLAFGPGGVSIETLEEIGKLLEGGPVRPGRPNKHEQLLTSKYESYERPVSSFTFHKPDGTEYSYGEKFDKLKTLKRRPFRTLSSQREMEWGSCPICGRSTVAKEPLCKIYREGQWFTHRGFRFKSSLCRQRKCAHKKVDVTPEKAQIPLKHRVVDKIN